MTEPRDDQGGEDRDALRGALDGLRRGVRERVAAAEAAVTSRFSADELFDWFETERRRAGAFGMEERSAEVDCTCSASAFTSTTSLWPPTSMTSGPVDRRWPGLTASPDRLSVLNEGIEISMV